MYKLYFDNESHTWENYTLLQETNIQNIWCLGRRLLLVENIGFSRSYKHLQTFTNIYKHSLTFATTFTNSYFKHFYKHFDENNDTKILMNSPALKLINSFKITCILRTPVDRYGGQVLRRRCRQASSFILIVYFWCLTTMKEHTCIKLYL